MVQVSTSSKRSRSIRPSIAIDISIWNEFREKYRTADERSIIVERLIELQNKNEVVKFYH